MWYNKRMENMKEKIAELEQARKNTKNKKEDKRILAIILKLGGNKVTDIAEKLDVSVSTIYLWENKYDKEGINGLLNKKRPGNNRNLSFEEEKEFLKQFEERANKGQIVSAKEIEAQYIKLVGHSIGGSQIYYLLKRHGFRKIMPRSKHPKKANDEVIETSKKLTRWQKS